MSLKPYYVGNGMVAGREDISHQCEYCGKRFALLHDVAIHEARRHESPQNPSE
jgi:hypothetical protein